VGEEREKRDEQAVGGADVEVQEVEVQEKEERGDLEDEGVGEQSSSKTRLDAVGDPDKPGVGPPPSTPKPA
jgi:hypothetical protein